MLIIIIVMLDVKINVAISNMLFTLNKITHVLNNVMRIKYMKMIIYVKIVVQQIINILIKVNVLVSVLITFNKITNIIVKKIVVSMLIE